MINYKKSLLSVAAAAAIATTSLSAGYLPLTSDANDNEWVILGVSGLKTDGAVATTPGVFSIANTVKTALTDATVDEIEATGMTVTGGNLVQLKAITNPDVEIRIDTTNPDTSDVAFLQSDPVRTIYVDTSGDGAPDFAVSYKSSLEGYELEYSIGGAAASKITINYENVFDNPVAGAAITGVPAVAGNELKSLTETDSVVDYDFSNNPPLSTQWAAADGHRDAISGAELRVYGYDAADSKWEIYDSRNTVNTNDFSEITAGKGYWARLDSDNSGTNSADKEAGLVLGTPSLTTANYANAGLAEGWNFISFDGVNSEIRNAAVGMLITLVSGTTTVIITDSSGNHSITVTPDALDTNIQFAKDVNSAIALAKIEGTLPKTVNIKAFPTNDSSATGQVAIVSNKKFTIEEGTGNKLGAATTLAGAVLLDPVTLVDTTNGADVTTAGVMSKYGEYAMVIQPLNGAGTAQALTNNPSSIEVIGSTLTSTLVSGANIAATQGVLNGHADLTATELDLGIDGVREDILVASTAPFRLRDHTFTRVFEYVTQGATNSDLDISVGTVVDIDIAVASDASTVAGVINTAGSAGSFSSDDDGAGNVVIVSDTALAAKFTVKEHTADLLQVAISSTDLAKGAVKNVYSLNYLSRLAVRNVLAIDLNEAADEAIDAYQLDFTTAFGTVVTGTNQVIDGSGWTDTGDNDASGTDDYVEFLDALVLQLNTDLAAAGLTATASHDGATNAIGLALITLDGVDVISLTLTQTAGVTTEAVTAVPADLGYIASYSGDMTVDLQYNSILTPDYVMKGPLYTMRDNNMTLKALVTGTTDIVTGTVSWESVDLTRKPSEWLNSQDYDLFDTDASSGYWAYLTPDASANPLSITSGTLSKEYTHHFDEIVLTSVGTTTNEFSGNLEVLVGGLNAVDNYLSARVTATIGGETFELTQDVTDKTKFTGSVSVHEAYGFNKNTPYDVIINVADGLGNNLLETLTILDNVQPASPTVVPNAGVLTVTTDPADGVAGIYIFSGTPPEIDPEANKLGFILGAGGIASAACSGTAAAYDDGAGGISVISVDGNGSLGQGNASSATNVAFMPIMISRVLMEDANVAGNIESSTGGNLYDATCVDQGPLTINTGVTLTAHTADTIVKMAYTSQGAAGTETPITMYVSDGAATQTIAEMKYPTSYAGTDVFFELNGVVYGVSLYTEAQLDALAGGGNSSANPIDLSDNVTDTARVNNNPKTGISL